jgi:hypothetical protein
MPMAFILAAQLAGSLAGPLAAPLGAQAAAPAGTLAEMDGYMSKALDALDSNHLSEAIRSYVAVLALAGDSPSAAAKAKAADAEAALARIATRLTLEPSSEWIDPKGSQIAGSSRSLGKDGGLSPAVYLFESFGTGKSPVADAPIFFQFAKNKGSLVALVTTDAYGKANTTVAKLDEPGKEAVIRAYPVFRSKGRDYAFQGVFRDFAYLPPANAAKVIVLESSELGSSDNPKTVDAVVGALKPLGLELTPLNGKLQADNFRKAFGGDAGALASLGVGGGSPYAALVLVEVESARQMEMNGKKYNIFTARASTTFRLVRANGSVVMSLQLDSIKGQGGTLEASVADALRQAGQAIGPALSDRQADIKKAILTE